MISRFRDWIWNKLFLDFYLDKSWTFRFKVLNFLSGDALREYLTSIHSCLSLFEGYKERGIYDASLFYAKRAKRWSDSAWKLCRRR